MADDYTIKIDSIGNGEIIRNGEKLTNVVSFMVEGGVEQLTALTLKLIDVDVDVSCEGLKRIADNPTGNGKGH